MADGEKAKKNQAMANYKSELNAQVRQKNSQWTHNELVDEDWQNRHIGLGLGDYKEPSKDELLNTLKKQVETKNTRCDQYKKIETNNATGGDWLARKQLIDKWNYDYIHDHRRHGTEHPKDNTKLLELKEMAIRENARKRREHDAEKQSDVDKVNDLVMNEKHQRYEEHIRNRGKAEVLQSALQTQMKEREVLGRLNAQEKDAEAKGTSFVTGSVNRFGNMNYDYRGDIQEKRDRKVDNFVENHTNDCRLVNNLDQ